jgi:hypothetical protein
MHETYREYLDQNSRRFLIIVFKDEKGYFLKIFLHRVLVYQFPFDAPDEDINMDSEVPVKSFDKFIKIARGWILTNY